MNYTQESLDAMRLKADVVEIAADLKLDTDGTRTEVTDRILAHVAASSEDETEEEEVTGEEVAEDAAPERAREEDGQYAADDEDTLPDEAYSPPTAGKLAPSAAKALEQLVGSYVGADNAKSATEEIVTAIEAGKQPCIVEGAGNVRFEVKIFDKIIKRSDPSDDIARGKDGVVLNLARFLLTKNLYPRG